MEVISRMQGHSDKIAEMKNWLQHTGSPLSSIDHAVFTNERSVEKAEFESFSIRAIRFLVPRLRMIILFLRQTGDETEPSS